MELQILLPTDATHQGIVHLKTYLDKTSIEGVERTDIERGEHGHGQMGAGDILDSIRTIVEAAEKPLVELIACLQRYVDNYRTTITIPTANGNIVLQHGRSMKPDELKSLVVAIQQNQN